MIELVYLRLLRNCLYSLVWIACSQFHGCQPDCKGRQDDFRDAETSDGIRFSRVDDGVQVYSDQELFTYLRTKPFAKPVFYPIFVDKQIGMTRNWPMQPDAKKEPVDHPHHKSLWIGHIINGVDFWSEQGGQVVVQDLQIDQANRKLRVKSDWICASNAKRICSDRTTYAFGSQESVRWIDVTIEFYSNENELRFEDTKEGTFAVRTHPDLQLTPASEAGPNTPTGTARNSEGVKGKEVWGKKAKWVLYQGKIEGVSVAISMFDHPRNLRHPTTWHARDYGLVSANPFGLHDFMGEPPGAGELIVAKGEKFTLRYRILFIKGEPTDNQIETWYREFEPNQIPSNFP